MKKYFMVEAVYEKTKNGTGKTWSKAPVKVEKIEVSEEYYKNIFDPKTVKFMRSLGGVERVIKGYNCEGYVPVELISISPDRSTKIVRRFTPVR